MERQGGRGWLGLVVLVLLVCTLSGGQVQEAAVAAQGAPPVRAGRARS